MRLEVFGEAKEEEKVLRLALVSMGDSSVDLAVVDTEGNPVSCGRLLTLQSRDGRVQASLPRHIDPELGLCLNNTGALLLR